MPEQSDDDAVPSEAVELYRLALEEFTSARDKLAKELKQGGDAKAAAAVKALRRPSNAAWALNQVAANHPDVVADVLDAGDDLRRASDEGDRATIVAAAKAERAARDAAADAAMRVLDADGTPGGSGVRQQVLDTLHAAEVDEAVAAALRSGTLDKAYASTGFDFGGRGAVVVRPKPAPVEKGRRGKLSLVKDPEDAKAATKAKAEAEEAARRERAERAARKQRAAEAHRAMKRADKLERDAEIAEARAAEIRQAADDARAEATRLTD